MLVVGSLGILPVLHLLIFIKVICLLLKQSPPLGSRVPSGIVRLGMLYLLRLWMLDLVTPIVHTTVRNRRICPCTFIGYFWAASCGIFLYIGLVLYA